MINLIYNIHKKPLNLRNKLLLVTFSGIFLVLIFGFVLINLMIANRATAEYSKNTVKRLSTTVELMNRELYALVEKSSFFVNNINIIRALEKNYEDDIQSVMTFYAELSSYNMQVIEVDTQLKEQFTIYPVNETLPEGKLIKNISRLKEDEIWDKITGVHSSDVIWDNRIKTKGSAEYTTFYRNMYTINQHIATIEIRIPVKNLMYYIDNFESRENEDVFYLSEPYPKRKAINTTGELINGQKITISISESTILKDYYIYSVLIFIIFLLLILFIFFVLSHFIRRITRSLYEFIDDIKDGKKIEIENDDTDIAVIKRKFKELILETEKMYGNIIAINKTKRAMELELLQAGINPHLLYNSLSVINWSFLKRGETDMAAMVFAMSNYYRMALNNGNAVVTLESELELILEYVKINEFSYSSTYDLTINADPELLGFHTIKLLLQPFVENSILHGLKGIENAKITINLLKSGNDIKIEVIDNGRGMPFEKLKTITDSDSGGYGIKNTIKRIKTYYGDEYGIDIELLESVGVKVSITIAKLSKNELIDRMVI